MRKIIYYVAISLDGFIAGPDDSIAGFVEESDGVQQYLEDLKSYDTVLMGRRTYEFGYQFGLQPGQPAYPHMEHYIFSRSLKFANPHPKVHVSDYDLELVRTLKAQQGTDIYLCGGGIFAGWLLQHAMIDVLKLKINPFISGQGIPLFKDIASRYALELMDQKSYSHGLQIITYDVLY